MTDLLKLAERVEAGERIGDEVFDALGLAHNDLAADNCAYAAIEMRSLDAAKALHEAVLAEWGWVIFKNCVRVWDEDDKTIQSEGAASPAAAWVAAILRAKNSSAPE